MKSYWDLTAKERLGLTETQINEVWIPREAAMQGLLRPAQPALIPVPEKPEIKEPTVMPTFKVRGINCDKSHDFSVVFFDMAGAQAFIALKPMGYEYTYGKGYSKRFHLLEFTSYEVEILNVGYENEFKDYDAALAEYNEAVESNERAMSEYQRKLNAIENSAQKLRRDRQALQARYNAMVSVIENLKDFIKVAEGDFKMACKFMLKKVDKQLLYDALQEFSETEGFTWETVEIFGGECLLEDLNPYREIVPNGMQTL